MTIYIIIFNTILARKISNIKPRFLNDEGILSNTFIGRSIQLTIIDLLMEDIIKN